MSLLGVGYAKPLQHESSQQLQIDSSVSGILDETPAVFSVALNAGDYVQLILDHSDAALDISIVHSDNSTLVDVKSRNLSPTEVAAVADRSDLYYVSVSSLESDRLPIRYSMTLVALTPLNPRSRIQLLAVSAYQMGIANLSLWRRAALVRAIRDLSRASYYWRISGKPAEAARALFQAGNAYESISSFDAAIDTYRAAMAVDNDHPSSFAAIDCLNSMANVDILRNDYQAANREAKRALTLSEEVAYLPGSAYALSSLGAILHYHGEETQSLEYFQKSLRISEQLADRRGKARTLSFISYVNHNMGDLPKALENQITALELWQSVHDQLGVADALQEIGNIYAVREQLKLAETLQTESLSLYTQIGNQLGEGYISDDMGYYYEHLDDAARAITFYREASNIGRHLGSALLGFTALSDLIRVELFLGHSQSAVVHSMQEKAYALHMSDARLAAFAEEDMGDVFSSLALPNESSKHYQVALRTFQRMDDPATQAELLLKLAHLAEKANDSKKVIELSRASEVLSHQVDDEHSAAEALYTIAYAEFNASNFLGARAQLEKCLKAVDDPSWEVRTHEQELYWLADIHKYYELYIETLISLNAVAPDNHLAERAFEFAERGRTRALVEAIRRPPDTPIYSDPLLEPHKWGPPGIEGNGANETLKSSPEWNASNQGRGVSGTLPNQKITESWTAKSEEHDLETAVAATRMSFEDLGEIQQLLGDDDMLLEFSLGDQQSFLWTLTTKKFATYRLPRRQVIEESVRHTRDWIVSNGQDNQAGSVPTPAVSPQKRDPMLELSRMLLGSVPDLAKSRRLLFVPDGALHFVPFSSLPIDESRGRAKTVRRPLIIDHEVVVVPSMQVVADLRDLHNKAHEPSTGIVIIADPIFEKDDPRIKNSGRRTSSITDDVLQDELKVNSSPGRPDGQGLSRLQFSGEEARSIATMAREESVTKLDGANASLASVQGLKEKSYKIVHFATHALVDGRRPEMSGVVLSLFNRKGDSIDGYLRVEDIYRLGWSADLVVLSGCSTALGKDLRGEGVVGLTSAFLAHGNPRIVSSLWKVDDEATSAFMQQFYRSLLTRKASPSEALRDAELFLMAQPRWQSPYYWGAFVLEGDWR
jgi:CHAT domain-containing protein/tetratricopeptide (TPR) repeat protein